MLGGARARRAPAHAHAVTGVKATNYKSEIVGISGRTTRSTFASSTSAGASSCVNRGTDRHRRARLRRRALAARRARAERSRTSTRTARTRSASGAGRASGPPPDPARGGGPAALAPDGRRHTRSSGATGARRHRGPDARPGAARAGQAPSRRAALDGGAAPGRRPRSRSRVASATCPRRARCRGRSPPPRSSSRRCSRVRTSRWPLMLSVTPRPARRGRRRPQLRQRRGVRRLARDAGGQRAARRLGRSSSRGCSARGVHRRSAGVPTPGSSSRGAAALMIAFYGGVTDAAALATSQVPSALSPFLLRAGRRAQPRARVRDRRRRAVRRRTGPEPSRGRHGPRRAATVRR